MDDPAVGFGDPKGKLGLLFQEDYRERIPGQGLGQGDSDDPAPYDDDIGFQ
jgi:hypothetical protein